MSRQIIGVDPSMLDRLIRTALEEDIGYCDVTTSWIVDPDVRARGSFLAKDDGIICGLPVAERVFKIVDPSLEFASEIEDGDAIHKGQIFASIEGSAASVLSAERVSLNFMQRLSGIATRTHRLAEKIKGYKAVITDTRKTTPGLRVLEKYAVRCGGGRNHRFGLYDGVLIKDNHIAVAGGIREAVQRVRRSAPHTLKIEVETESREQVLEALECGADIIMLDNMTDDQIAEMVKLIAGRAVVEASGRMDEGRVVSVASTGVDLISIGALTYASPALDISLDIVLT